MQVNTGSLDIQDGSIELFNAQGIRIMTRRTEAVKMQIDLTGLTSGIYLLIFKNKETVVSEKIVVK